MNKNVTIGMFLFLFFASFYAIFSIGHFGGDGYQDYLTAESIVLDGNLSFFDRPGDVDELQHPVVHGKEGRDGKIYSSRGGFGMPLLLVPFYFIGHVIAGFLKSTPHDYVTMLMVSFANPLFSALNAILVFLIGAKMGFNRRTALSLSLIYGLATMAPVYARTGFAEPAMTLFLLLAAHSVLGYGISFRARQAVLAAFFLGCMFLCKASSLIFVACFYVYMGWSLAAKNVTFSKQAKDMILFTAVFGAIFVAALALNYIVYGGAFYFGNNDAVAIGGRIASAPHVLKGFYYYLLSTGKGFFIFNIPCVLLLFSLGRALRKNKMETVFFLLIMIVNLLFYVKSFRRGSLFSWGPRYLMMSVPFAVLLVGYFIEKHKSVLARVFVTALLVAGYIVAFPCLFINQSKFYNFAVEKLGVQEYMINFIPDLSPIKGAWCLFVSGLADIYGGRPFVFTYDPDYRLVEPVSSVMTGYNYFDLWCFKVAQLAPVYFPVVLGAAVIFGFIAVFSVHKLGRME